MAAFREANRIKLPGWHHAPVPSFGASDASVLVVGLAPGLRGANRTGRPFTGDFAGDILYEALAAHGLAEGVYRADPSDGFRLLDARVTNAARCVPPENKPTPAEVATCRRFLMDELTMPPRPKVVLALGRIAHESTLRGFGCRPSDFPFGHATVHRIDDATSLVSSYHTSRYNIQTGRLTRAMFDQVMAKVAALRLQAG
ncbi:MAG TPA: uracil-DNA glycosylase [Geminicoccus sp.]|uniref:uracil-DNA glycosylase n=1 Tax=Geminicoccus sp. TaxID=2024832 RepID=UPI002E35BD75|nr:uracil-DNA glycosylase [Geminicoccus sp.]HEX2525765.1 uracil-DNA glycosylase [Geminicoccus sp.]